MLLAARIVFGLLLVSVPVAAQEAPAQKLLPDKPAPRGNFLTRPFYDKKVTLLAEINVGAAVMDDVASRKVIESGGYERKTLIPPFLPTSSTTSALTVS